MVEDVSARRGVATSTAGESEVLVDYWSLLPEVVNLIVDDPAPRLEAASFSPGFALPELDARLRAYLSPARARWIELGSHAGRTITLLDLATNPATHTTKTFASLVIVARAIEFTRRTGQGVYIISPTSANKGTALRDAVMMAYNSGLASPETLRVAVIAPHSCRHKLRSSPLDLDLELRRLNPLMIYTGQSAEDVKTLARSLAEQHSGDIFARTGMFPWFTLDLRNYMLADATRAFFERDASPAGTGRAHAHAVSSAFGLLGYHLGRRLLEETGMADPRSRPASLLVQQLATPDMVLHLLYGSFDRSSLPRYAWHQEGDWRQNSSPHFPHVTAEPDEAIDPTFYTRRPATSAAMDSIIARYGGTGIVVSRKECLARYGLINELIAGIGRGLPADPDELQEWSLVMALTGTLNALERNLLPHVSEVVVHGSGWYASHEFAVPHADALVMVRGLTDVLGSVTG